MKIARNGQGRQHHHEQDAENVFQYEHTQHRACKLLPPQSQVVKGFIDNRGGRHSQHAAQKQAVHSRPTHQVSQSAADAHHTSNNHAGCPHGSHAHLENLLERKLQPEREHEEDDANFGPRIDRRRVLHRRSIGHVRPCQEACHNIAQHQGLAEALEDEGDNACHNKDEGEVAQERGDVGHTGNVVRRRCPRDNPPVIAIAKIWTGKD